MKRKKNINLNSNPSTNGKKTFISKEKKQKVIGLFLFILSVLLLISILSYSPDDEDNLTNLIDDIKRDIQFSLDNSISSKEYLQKRFEINNWMGSAGAHIARFFVKYSIGYFSVSFPIIIFLLSLIVIKQNNKRKILVYSNVVLIISIFLSAFFGVINSQFYSSDLIFSLSGKIGNFVGLFLGKTFGTIGSVLIILFLVVSTLVLLFDFKFEIVFKNIFSAIKSLFVYIFKNPSMSDVIVAKSNEISPNKKSSKIEKQELREPESIDQNQEEETRIRIIKKTDSDIQTSIQSDLPEKKSVRTETKERKSQTEKEKSNIDEKLLPNQWEEKIDYNFPSIDLLNLYAEEDYSVAEEELTKNAQLLKDKLKLFDIDIKDISVTPGPVVTLYEIVPSPGVKISRIVGLENDIALALAAKGIRIIAPIPGKSAIGVEIPNLKASLVTAKSVLSQIKQSNFELPLALGKTISGDVYLTDLSKMPHLLIAGSTGSGKSVGINMIISSLLYSKHPSEVKFCLIDPKKIELSFYQKIRKHFLAISPDLDESIITTPQNAVILLKAIELEMNKRYDKLSNAGVRNIVDYNTKVSNPKTKPNDTEIIKHHPIPYIVVVIDELADLMLTSGREVEEPITRLAQMARAVGIHLILATQRPSVNVITGVIKANFSARIAYQVATKIDSRTIIDMNGAEQLLGSGDMLFLPTGSPKPIRIQNAFISTDEVERITNHIYSQPAFSKPYYLPSLYEAKVNSGGRLSSDFDPMFEDAAKIIVKYQQGSVSLLQRKLKLGYSRAARIIDQLEEAGIVGPNDGSKARMVLVDNEETLETILRSL